MRYLLDTHVWLWLQSDPTRVSDDLRSRLADLENELLLSAASSWEIAIKYALGRLPLPEPPSQYLPSRMSRSGTRGLPVQHHHACAVADLPPHHQDPFDRMLVAQAIAENATLVTADRQMSAYEVDLLSV